MIIGSSAHHRSEKIQRFLQALTQLIAQSFFRTFFKLEVVGGEKAFFEIQKEKAVGRGIIFAANHTHELDSVLVRCALPLKALFLPMYYVAMTKDHYSADRYGWRRFLYGGDFFKILGAYPAYLGLHDYRASLIHHLELLEDCRCVCIFPEGKISVDTQKPAEPKGGVGFLVAETGSSVVPVKITGLIGLSWLKVFTFHRPILRIEYLTPLTSAELIQSSRDAHVPSGIETYKNIARLVMSVIRK